jgi:hypothetical protein
MNRSRFDGCFFHTPSTFSTQVAFDFTLETPAFALQTIIHGLD